MIARCALAALLLLACCANAATTQYSVNPTYSSIGFSIVKWSVIKEEGIFRDFSGTLDFDPAHPEGAKIDVVIRATSIDTKNTTRDDVVRSEDFLDVNQFPTLEFHSVSVEHVGTQTLVTGDLTKSSDAIDGVGGSLLYGSHEQEGGTMRIGKTLPGGLKFTASYGTVFNVDSSSTDK